MPTIDDASAMDAIHTLLSGKEWDSDTLMDVADIVTQSGREVLAYDDVMEGADDE